ncbi:acyl-CoA carboxylase subunit epsilon [Streptomyces sp. NBC_01619]|uniref:Acyl-CoA carboxylase subunit epsilon n=1 Tax=Streptomyces pratisoli TaxID=3139917 RepID=A0ACC6QPV9_9ACTN|nr:MULTISPECIES: acyl-CoA carboxylase subunit epsilon [unclassified Streptomyces]MCX4514856.1 acyl-CoA carboxylase subunit epsilon [Streptomyces sp. NBC_01619]
MDVDLRIVHGAPDDEELAALMAVLTVLAHRRAAARATPGGGRPRRAHWDRTWGGGFQPCGSWRERDRTVMSFDPGSR